MARYVPSPMEQRAINLLRLAGFAVVRRATYDGLRKRLDLAEHRLQWEAEVAQHARDWATGCHATERHLIDRLNAVVAAAAALGVSIQDINAALAAADTKD